MQKFKLPRTDRVKFHRGHDTLCKIIILFFLHDFAEIVQKLQKLYPLRARYVENLRKQFTICKICQKLQKLSRNVFFESLHSFYKTEKS